MNVREQLFILHSAWNPLCSLTIRSLYLSPTLHTRNDSTPTYCEELNLNESVFSDVQLNICYFCQILFKYLRLTCFIYVIHKFPHFST
jgi:hypothetical protein